MCDHCGCRQGSIGRLMDQHERIQDLAQRVRGRLAAGDETGARATLAELRSVLDPHTTWEERGLFVRMAEQGDFADHVAALEAEHAELHALLSTADAAPAGWAAAVRVALDRLDGHIYRENFGLFPGAISVLDAADWAAIRAAQPAGLTDASPR